MQRQTTAFAACLTQQDAPGVFRNLPQRNHYTILDALGSNDGLILESLRVHLSVPSVR